MLNFIDLNSSCSIAREKSTRTNRLNSLLIKNQGQEVEFMIDANYPFSCLDELYKRIDASKNLKLILSHCHLDHTGHVFYHLKKYKTPIYCPVQEKDYLTSLDSLMERVGFNILGLKEEYKKFARKRVNFKEPNDVNVYTPGNDVFEVGSVKIKTIHIPGHSPGQTAFIIETKTPKVSKNDNGNTEQNDSIKNGKILYVADIGSHPYYGDLNSDLNQYKESIDKLELIYLSDRYILVLAHGNFYIEKEENFFNRIRNKINNNEEKVINALEETRFKTITELVREHIITPKERIYEPIRDLYLLWDGGKIYHHLNDLRERGIVQKQEGTDILSDKYKLKQK